MLFRSGIGSSTGENRASEATKKAISSPLLEVSIDGAEHVLVNVTGGKNLSMFEAQEASSVIRQAANTNVDITFGMALDDNLGDEVRVTVIATGIDKKKQEQRRAAQEQAQTPAAEETSEQAPTAGTGAPSEQAAPVKEDPFSGWDDDLGTELTNRQTDNFSNVEKPDFSVQNDNLSNVDDGGEDLSTPAFFKNRRK